jgi:hypothetical protein
MKINDPKKYREMSVPFATTEEANAALNAFFEDVKAAREKHRISDVVVLCEISHKIDDEEVRGGAFTSLGDRARVIIMLAREFGAEQARHEAAVAGVIARARKSAT